MSTTTVEVIDDEHLIIHQEVALEKPPEGRHPAVCADVVYLGEEESEFDNGPKMQPKAMIVFQLFPLDGSRTTEGLPFQVEQKLTISLHPQSTMRKKLERWRGREFRNDEVEAFNLVTIKRAPAWVTILHDPRGIFANIVDIEPYVDESGNPLPAPEPEGYKRRRYAPKPAKKGTASQTPKNGKADDEYGVPF